MSQKRKSKVVGVILLVMLFVAPGATLGGELITAVTRTGSTWAPPAIFEPFGEFAQCYVDRSHLYSGLPGELPDLLGAEYIITAENDRNVDNVTMEVTLAADAAVYLLLDNRLGGTGGGAGVDPILDAEMAWVSGLGFTDTGFDIGIDEGGNGSVDQHSSIFVANLAAGTHTFGEQHDGIFRSMYGIVAVAGEATAIAATIDIAPGTVNMKSRGPWLICAIMLGEGGDVADIDVESIRLNGEFGAQRPTIDDDGETLTVRFSLGDFKASLELGELDELTVELIVTGQLTSGDSFEGSDTIRVLNKGNRRGRPD